MLGRKKKDSHQERDDALLDQATKPKLDQDGGDDETIDVDGLDEDGLNEEVEDLETDEDGEDGEDEWSRLDQSVDWREDGPFDLDEVDLDDDPVQRLDFGTLILTPFEGMQLQLQLDQATGSVQTALVLHGTSGLEVALFAAPRSGGLAREVRQDMLAQAVEAGGTAELASGPFGTEIRRAIPMQTPDGQQAMHISRTWLVEGPRWLLRGVLMGEACLGGDEQAHEFLDFYKNVIVRRGEAPMPSGDLIAMTLPDEMKPQAEQ